MLNRMFFVVISFAMFVCFFVQNVEAKKPIEPVVAVTFSFEGEKTLSCGARIDDRGILVVPGHCFVSDSGDLAKNFIVCVGLEFNKRGKPKCELSIDGDGNPDFKSEIFTQVEWKMPEKNLGFDGGYAVNVDLIYALRDGSLGWKPLPYGSADTSKSFYVETKDGLVMCAAKQGGSSLALYAKCPRAKLAKGHSGSPVYQKDKFGDFKYIGFISAGDIVTQNDRDLIAIQLVSREDFNLALNEYKGSGAF